MSAEQEDLAWLSLIASKILDAFPKPAEAADLRSLLRKHILTEKERDLLTTAGIELGKCELRNGKCRSVVFRPKSGGPIIITDLRNRSSTRIPVSEVKPFVERIVHSRLVEKHWCVTVEAPPGFVLIADGQSVAFIVPKGTSAAKVQRCKNLIEKSGCTFLKEKKEEPDQHRIFMYNCDPIPKLISSLFYAVLSIAVKTKGDAQVHVSIS